MMSWTVCGSNFIWLVEVKDGGYIAGSHYICNYLDTYLQALAQIKLTFHEVWIV